MGRGEACFAKSAPTVEKMLKVFGACVLFGAAYGAVFGGFYEPVFWDGEATELLSPATHGALFGAGFGALGGGVAGFIGNIVGGRVGWCLAGVLGGVGSAACLWYFTCLAQPWIERVFWPQALLACAGVVLIGSFLGVMLGAGLRKGRSVVSGVQLLVAIINDGSASGRSGTPHGARTEVSPAAAPEGRGDEPAPGRPMSSR
jgi:hypothetical protein